MHHCAAILILFAFSIDGSAQRLYRIPIVVHILHRGDAEGTGFNFSKDRVVAQIRTLNEDFRRKKDTPGFNDHPDGADTNIEFVLAEIDPDGNPTDGIDRVDISKIQQTPSAGDVVSLCSRYSYWDADRYLNVWSLDLGLPPGVFLGSSRFPIADLPGLDNLSPRPEGDGTFINALNFGSGADNTDPNYNMGRTLTHEIGHFLGLLHTFGSINNSRQCDGYTDYCDDTPPIPVTSVGCSSVAPIACDGRPVMTGNYMDGAYDVCMNIFTRDQVARMRKVLENSPQRASLATSAVIDRTVENGVLPAASVYPNPVTDNLYVSLNGQPATVAGFLLSGQKIFREKVDSPLGDVGIPMDQYKGEIILVMIKVDNRLYRFTVTVKK